MSDNNIHPLSFVEKGAVIGKNVVIEPFAVVKKNVVLEDHVVIKSHAYIDGFTRIGEGTIVWPSASVGTKTQDLKYKGEKTYVDIGKQCEIREFVTINSSTQEGSTVKVGDQCLIMAYCHIAHNCTVGKGVIMSNNATLAGHVEVEDFAIIGGHTPVHQFSRIGAYSMVGGMSRVTNDVPPYTIGGGIPYKLGGINLVGLKRRAFPYETRKLLSQAFKWMYRSGLHIEDALRKVEEELPKTPEILHWLAFCRASQRGLICQQGIVNASQDSAFSDSDTLEE
ncbi:MAG: acyl-ACP--UDP-N-acetylglucosamine O-acyltransferase [Chlamydiales bacterium]|nr:acyl-ACP--UDP-N-acetylglucosamine O-acyltransferase [Chlamydiales bacterium]